MSEIPKRLRSPFAPPALALRPAVPRSCMAKEPHHGPLCVGFRNQQLVFMCLGHVREHAKKLKDPDHYLEDWILADLPAPRY
jgi:hypothetical protein